jgi:SnoaL-like domain
MALVAIDDIDSSAPSSSHLEDLAYRRDPSGGHIDHVSPQTRSTQGVAMTTFAPHRDTVESFVDVMHSGADEEALSGILAEDVVLYSPLGDKPTTGREAVLEAIRGIGGAADLRYKEILTGKTHHAAYFRLHIEDTTVDGMDRFRLDADGKIAEVTIWWRPLPAGVALQRNLADALGMAPWELHTNGH